MIKQRVIDIRVVIFSEVPLPSVVFVLNELQSGFMTEALLLFNMFDATLERGDQPDVKNVIHPGGNDIAAAADDDHVADGRQVENSFCRLADQLPGSRVKAEKLIENIFNLRNPVF